MSVSCGAWGECSVPERRAHDQGDFGQFPAVPAMAPPLRGADNTSPECRYGRLAGSGIIAVSPLPFGVPMSKVIIAGAKRTALGALLGQFTGVPATQLGSTAIKAAMDQSGVAGDKVDEVIM